MVMGPGIARIVANASAFNIGWLACILASRWGAPLAAVPAVGIVLLVQLLMLPRRRRSGAARAILTVTALGTIVDTAMLSAGILRFQDSTLPSLTFVLWIGSFWVNFAALPNVSLVWLRGRPLLAAALGAVSAPGTYLLGERLGALELHASKPLALGVIALEWALLLPVIMWLARAVATGEVPGTGREGSRLVDSEPEGRPVS